MFLPFYYYRHSKCLGRAVSGAEKDLNLAFIRYQGPLAVTTSTWTSTTGSWKTNHDATTHAQTSTSSSSTPRWGRHLPPSDVLWWTWVLLDLFSSIFWLNFAISWIPRFFLVDKTEAVGYSCCCEVKNSDFSMLQEKFDSLSITALGQRSDGCSRNIRVSFKRLYKCKLYYLNRIW